MNQNYKKEYFLKAGNVGCLLIHGITGTPAELRELGERLFDAGYTVMGVRLKGHGTKLEDMLSCTYQDWIQSAIIAYNQLKKECEKVYVIGHSMGSLISLYLAEKFEVDKVVTLSPPFVQKNKSSDFAFIAKYFIKYANWSEREFTKEQEKYILGYSSIPIKSIHELNKLKALVKKQLNKVTCPILIVHSKADNIVHNKSVDFLYNKVSSKLKHRCYLETSGHLIAVESEKEKVFEEVLKFFSIK